MSQLKKRVMVKNRDECGQKSTGADGLFTSWAEQMVRDKLAIYNRNVEFGYEDERYTYEVVKETAKAYQLRITGVYKYTHGGDDFENCDDWDMWLPKSACVICE